MKRIGMLTVLLSVTATIAAGSASAAADLNVQTHESVRIGAPVGTFSLTGDLSDAGILRFNTFLLTRSASSPVATEHVTETLIGAAGTLELQKQCRSVFIGFGFTDECQALVTGGTGAYEGLHGVGTCSGIINFTTGIATQTCDLRLQA